MVEENKRDQI